MLRYARAHQLHVHMSRGFAYRTVQVNMRMNVKEGLWQTAHAPLLSPHRCSDMIRNNSRVFTCFISLILVDFHSFPISSSFEKVHRQLTPPLTKGGQREGPESPRRHIPVEFSPTGWWRSLARARRVCKKLQATGRWLTAEVISYS